MRRTALTLLLLAVALLWVMPASAARNSVSHSSYTAVAEGKRANHKKKTPTPVPHKHKKKKPTKHKATPVPTAKPKRKATPKPTRTAAPVVAMTATPTSTATPVPTPTLTPTPEPLTATMALKSNVPMGYSAAFFVCGLPAGVSATFTPNPAASLADQTSPNYSSAQTTVTVSVPYTVAPNTYGLSFYAYYKDAHGAILRAVPDGTVLPQFATLAVQTGSATLAPAPAVPPDGGQGCSAVPAGYQPQPLPTVGPSDYALTSWVSDAHPKTGETVTVYAQLMFQGQPVHGATVVFAWYSYGVTRSPCVVVTDGTGTASCSTVNSTPLAGVPVTIEATVYYNAFTFNSWTSYTM